MKYLFITYITLFLVACNQSDDQRAEKLVSQIDSLYEHGCYSETLDSIMSLRSRYPKALSSRKKALHIWRDASLRLAQKDIAETDSALQATLQKIDGETNLYKANMLRARRDSLKARYEAMCGVVRMIHLKQKEDTAEEPSSK